MGDKTAVRTNFALGDAVKETSRELGIDTLEARADIQRAAQEAGLNPERKGSKRA